MAQNKAATTQQLSVLAEIMQEERVTVGTTVPVILLVPFASCNIQDIVTYIRNATPHTSCNFNNTSVSLLQAQARLQHVLSSDYSGDFTMPMQRAQELAEKFCQLFDANTAHCFCDGAISLCTFERGVVIADGKHLGIVFLGEED